MKYKGILFTDIDGTWKRWSMFLEIMDAMVAESMLPSEVGIEVKKLEEQWRARNGSFEDYIIKAVELFEKNLAGVPFYDYEELVAMVLEKSREDVYRYTRALIRKKLAEGWYVHAISASPELAVKLFCEYWGIHSYNGTKMTVQNGVFTGERQVIDYDRKVGMLKKVIERVELEDGAEIWACGDSGGDISMLRMADVAVAINPSSDLAREALRRGWRLVLERKDLIVEHDRQYKWIYTLDKDDNVDLMTLPSVSYNISRPSLYY